MLYRPYRRRNIYSFTSYAKLHGGKTQIDTEDQSDPRPCLTLPLYIRAVLATGRIYALQCTQAMRPDNLKSYSFTRRKWAELEPTRV